VVGGTDHINSEKATKDIYLESCIPPGISRLIFLDIPLFMSTILVAANRFSPNLRLTDYVEDGMGPRMGDILNHPF
jgi:hypothetical protein